MAKSTKNKIGKSKPKSRPKTVNVPRKMADQILIIIAHEEFGVYTTDEFVRNAVRDSIDKYTQILREQILKKASNRSEN